MNATFYLYIWIKTASQVIDLNEWACNLYRINQCEVNACSLDERMIFRLAPFVYKFVGKFRKLKSVQIHSDQFCWRNICWIVNVMCDSNMPSRRYNFERFRLLAYVLRKLVTCDHHDMSRIWMLFATLFSSLFLSLSSKCRPLHYSDTPLKTISRLRLRRRRRWRHH